MTTIYSTVGDNSILLISCFVVLQVSHCCAEDFVDVFSTNGLGKSVREVPYAPSDVVPELPIQPPPKEADIEYVLRLVERKKMQFRTYRALEKYSDCLYTYRDVAVQIFAETCPASSVIHRPEWMIDVLVEGNNTSSYPFPCTVRTKNVTAGVNLVNSSECLRILGQDPETDEEGAARLHCAVVLFFSSSCPFSIKMAPSYNAFGRSFPGVDVIAVDVSQSSGLYTRYGIVAVPDILLFHRGKAVLRFNYTERSYENLVAFVQINTGLEPEPDIQVSAIDYEGPLPTTLASSPDYLLWFSNTFVILFMVYMIKKRLGESILERVREYMDYARQVWRTGEFYEQVGAHENEDVGFG